ncbi:unnamed protein product, partial [Mesorhabditis spiculigera]
MLPITSNLEPTTQRNKGWLLVYVCSGYLAGRCMNPDCDWAHPAPLLMDQERKRKWQLESLLAAARTRYEIEQTLAAQSDSAGWAAFSQSFQGDENSKPAASVVQSNIAIRETSGPRLSIGSCIRPRRPRSKLVAGVAEMVPEAVEIGEQAEKGQEMVEQRPEDEDPQNPNAHAEVPVAGHDADLEVAGDEQISMAGQAEDVQQLQGEDQASRPETVFKATSLVKKRCKRGKYIRKPKFGKVEAGEVPLATRAGSIEPLQAALDAPTPGAFPQKKVIRKRTLKPANNPRKKKLKLSEVEPQIQHEADETVAAEQVEPVNVEEPAEGLTTRSGKICKVPSPLCRKYGPRKGRRNLKPGFQAKPLRAVLPRKAKQEVGPPAGSRHGADDAQEEQGAQEVQRVQQPTSSRIQLATPTTSEMTSTRIKLGRGKYQRKKKLLTEPAGEAEQVQAEGEAVDQHMHKQPLSSGDRGDIEEMVRAHVAKLVYATGARPNDPGQIDMDALLDECVRHCSTRLEKMMRERLAPEPPAHQARNFQMQKLNKAAVASEEGAPAQPPFFQVGEQHLDQDAQKPKQLFSYFGDEDPETPTNQQPGWLGVDWCAASPPALQDPGEQDLEHEDQPRDLVEVPETAAAHPAEDDVELADEEADPNIDQHPVVDATEELEEPELAKLSQSQASQPEPENEEQSDADELAVVKACLDVINQICGVNTDGADGTKMDFDGLVLVEVPRCQAGQEGQPMATDPNMNAEENENESHNFAEVAKIDEVLEADKASCDVNGNDGIVEQEETAHVPVLNAEDADPPVQHLSAFPLGYDHDYCRRQDEPVAAPKSQETQLLSKNAEQLDGDDQPTDDDCVDMRGLVEIVTAAAVDDEKTAALDADVRLEEPLSETGQEVQEPSMDLNMGHDEAEQEEAVEIQTLEDEVDI